jgi:hypothetical protein
MKIKTLTIIVVGIAVIGIGVYMVSTRTSEQIALEDDGFTRKPNDLRDTPIVDLDVPPYKGEAIDEVGDDPIIKDYPVEIVESYKEELAELATELSENPFDFDNWVRVGVLKKFFRNFEGARQVWEYANIIAPVNSVAHSNLGDLYGFYLNEFEKAEENYLKAIEVDPQFSQFYIGLAEFYYTHDRQPDAEDIINRGLETLPGDETLTMSLKRYGK